MANIICAVNTIPADDTMADANRISAGIDLEPALTWA